MGLLAIEPEIEASDNVIKAIGLACKADQGHGRLLDQIGVLLHDPIKVPGAVRYFRRWPL